MPQRNGCAAVAIILTIIEIMTYVLSTGFHLFWGGFRWRLGWAGFLCWAVFCSCLSLQCLGSGVVLGAGWVWVASRLEGGSPRNGGTVCVLCSRKGS